MGIAHHILFFEEAQGDFVFLRLVFFHWTFFDVGISEILEDAGVDIPEEVLKLIEIIETMETSPTPVSPDPIISPSIGDLLSMIPISLSQGLPFPRYSGNTLPGLILNPGGEPVYDLIPFDCRLMDIKLAGLAFFVQSGMLNLNTSLVTQVSLCYKKASERGSKRPGLSLEDFYFAGVSGDFLFYMPINQPQGCGDADDVAGYQEAGAEIFHYMTPLLNFPDISETPDQMPFWQFLKGDYKFDFEMRKLGMGLVIPLFSNLSWQYGSQYPGAVSGVYPSNSYLASQGYIRWIAPVGQSIKILRDTGVIPCWYPAANTLENPIYIVDGAAFEKSIAGLGISFSALSLARQALWGNF